MQFSLQLCSCMFLVAILDIMQQPGISPDVGMNTAMLLSKNERLAS